MPCSSCKKVTSAPAHGKRADPFVCDVTCCAPRCDYKQDPHVLQAIGIVKAHCYPAVDAPSQGDSMFGFSLALSQDGNVLVVGAPNYTVGTATNAGAVFVFERQPQFAACKLNDVEPFTLVQILTADKPESTDGMVSNNGNFGMSVAISGDRSRIAVGAPFQNVGPSTESNTDEGAVFIFERGTKGKCEGLHLWHKIQVVYAQKRASSTDCTVVRHTDYVSGFGSRIALSRNGGVLVAANFVIFDEEGESGVIYIYEDCTPGPSFSPCVHDKTPYQFRQRITQQEVSDASGIARDDLNNIGNCVAITGAGETIVFGATNATISGEEDTGAVFIYRRCVTEWIFSQEIDGPLPGQGDFGVAVAITPCGTYLVVEVGDQPDPPPPLAPNSNGFAIVYKQTSNTGERVYIKQQTLDPSSNNDQNVGQRSIAISDDGCLIAVGFEFSNSPSTASVGNVLVFERQLSSNSANSSSTSCANSVKKCETKWVLKQTLVSDPEAEKAYFGTAVAMSGSGLTLAVSAPSVDDGGIVDPTHVDVAFTFSSTFKPCQLAART